ncbi:hypothetical protein [Stenotrophomonas maltophilia]|uniref:hypothetical protein n=1 Tax=Stenotrophomonas maltophilia TaxID=40324 RepID=UPI002091C619|nr:hypothetical protein [Stenotrophomonas maltophilia]MCO5735908.1 hypothetical protein [Stenotrophomonas maltophilia]
MNAQNAILSAGRENGKNLGQEKETIDTYNVVVRTEEGMFTAITLRLYMGRSRGAQTVYASIWVHGQYSGGAPYHTAGHGQAGGFGYCKRSAATACAIKSAGIELHKSISGVGESAMRDALLAIGTAMGYSEMLIVTG